MRKFLLDAQAPVNGASLLEGAIVSGKIGLLRRAEGSYSVRIVISIVANAGQRAGEVFELRVLVVKADAGGEFG